MIRGLTIRQPFAGAIALCDGERAKRVENRDWRPTYRGWVAIHAAASLKEDDRAAILDVAALTGRPVGDVETWCQTRGKILAVARLSYVCSRTTGFAECECGPWAIPGQQHLRLTDVLALPDPVPCRGMLNLWKLPTETLAAVRRQWRTARYAAGDTN
jgi:hypothetical protein